MEDFDAASAADAALRPFLWQRGITAYYAGPYLGYPSNIISG